MVVPRSLLHNQLLLSSFRPLIALSLFLPSVFAIWRSTASIGNHHQGAWLHPLTFLGNCQSQITARGGTGRSRPVCGDTNVEIMATTTAVGGIGRSSRLVPEYTMFFCCDIQERFRSLIVNMPHVVHTAATMAQSCRILGIPLVVTEQNPRALLPTVAEVDVSNAFKVEKTRFSMMVPQVTDFMRTTPDRKNVVLFGIEAHVCVQQTALDLLSEGCSVHLICDGISSQRAIDRSTALRRMQQAGAHLTTSESVLFELISDSTHPNFKPISALMKQPRPAERLPSDL
eukprot:GHVS01083729.1.p1 GENE.GHVS01083729.1~~GHVS01083729.1.p1  ORF type:complete len:286 (-),score=33.79 GHVS01083729.1:261-1118(-)